MGTHKDLLVYNKAFMLAMDIFEISKQFPPEERYSMTDQIRRSSRSVCTCIAEGYRKRIYQAHFVSKMTDANMENTETQTWLDFALACKYLSHEKFIILSEQNEEVGRILSHIIQHPEKYSPFNQKKN